MTDRRLRLGENELYHRCNNGIEIHWEFFGHFLGMVKNSEHVFVNGTDVNSFDAARLAVAIENIDRDFSFDLFMHQWGDPDATVMNALVEFLNEGRFEIVEEAQ